MPPEAALVMRVLPIALVLYTLTLALWASAPAVFGIVPADLAFGVVIVVAVAAAAWPKTPLRFGLVAAVTLSELGLATTFFFEPGASSLDLPRSSEWLAASIHLFVWVVVLACQVTIEAFLTVAGELDDR